MTAPTAIAALLALTCVGCLNTTGSYFPPGPSEPDQWVRTVERPYDETWEALVDVTSRLYFGIDNFERDSGLMTLTFGSEGVSGYVDGGDYVHRERVNWNPLTNEHTGRDIVFDGNYAAFIDRYMGAELDGKMNLFIRPISETATEVRVLARYVVSTEYGARSVWAFDTGGSATVEVWDPPKGTSPTRTLRPTHAAEIAIITAIEALAQQR